MADQNSLEALFVLAVAIAQAQAQAQRSEAQIAALEKIQQAEANQQIDKVLGERLKLIAEL